MRRHWALTTHRAPVWFNLQLQFVRSIETILHFQVGIYGTPKVRLFACWSYAIERACVFACIAYIFSDTYIFCSFSLDLRKYYLLLLDLRATWLQLWANHFHRVSKLWAVCNVCEFTYSKDEVAAWGWWVREQVICRNYTRITWIWYVPKCVQVGVYVFVCVLVVAVNELNKSSLSLGYIVNSLFLFNNFAIAHWIVHRNKFKSNDSSIDTIDFQECWLFVWELVN